MDVLKPPALKPGDTIGIVAPASHSALPSALNNGRRSLETLGFRTVTATHHADRHGFLAGRDDDRLGDLEAMFADPDIQGIVCLRGGYGSARMLPRMDFEMIRAHPKVFVGYSDITALHGAIRRHTGLVTFWGPMVSSDMSPDFRPFNRDAFMKAVTGTAAIGTIPHPDDLPPVQVIRGGTAVGPLIGGTLSLLAAAAGTPYEFEYDGAILFFEDVGEEPHRIDRMLTQLLQAGRLERVSGIVIGECAGCGSAPNNPAFPYGNFSIEEVFAERLLPLGIPVIFGLGIGHGTYKATLPLGVRATLDGDARRLTIEESGVG
ncbi:MAG: LD-carboxypeptidase [Gemmatimonadetes bacterium]|nr:LD-carboxypeptidase [Gemmatimonadota bacterium]